MTNENEVTDPSPQDEQTKNTLQYAHQRGGESSRSHYVLVYETHREKLATVTEFLYRGLKNDERCIATYDESFLDDLRRALGAMGIDITTVVEDEQLVLEPPEETYLAADELTAESLGYWLDDLVEDRHPERVRVSGGMSWAIDALSDLEILAEYERLSDEIIEESSLSALCPYGRSEFPDEFLSEIISHHPMYRTSLGSCTNIFQKKDGDSSSMISEEGVGQALDTLERLTQHSSQTEKIHIVTKFAESIEMAGRGDEAEFMESIVEVVVALFSPSFTAIWEYDSETGDFEPTRPKEMEFREFASLSDTLSDRVWDVYTSETEIQTASLPTSTRSDAGEELPIDDAVFVPLGRHGVLVIALPAYDSLTDSDVAILHTLQAKIHIALDTMSYRRTVQNHTSRLEEQTEQIQELEEIVSLQNTNHELVEATSRVAVEETICEQLVGIPKIEFAWFGRHHSSDDVVRATCSSETGEGYVDAVTAHTENPVLKPASTAHRTNQTTIVHDVYTDPPFEPWRAQTLRRGYRSIASVPVVFRGTNYGVITVYSDEPNAFENRTQCVLENLGKCVGHAISSCQNKNALISDQVTELGIRIRDRSLPSIALANVLETELTFEGVVPQRDGAPRTYFTVHDCTRDEVEVAASQSYGIVKLTHVVERGDGHLFATTVDGSCFFERLLEYGGTPNSVAVTADEAEMTIEIPENASTHAFISMLEQQYDEVQITSQETRERAYQARDEFRQEFEEELSDRQKEVLRTAYYSGYFESPRKSTGQSIADQLDVSQPTVTENIRGAERELLTLLLESQ